MTILLADADLDNVKNFRLFIRTNFPDYKVVSIIHSASQLMTEVRETMPQLILADIRLFAHQAVTLVREVHETFPDIGFIVYGSYADTEYMEKVMEFGVIDYMYRPVKPTDLERCLRGAAARLTELAAFKKEREALEAAYRGNVDMFRDRFIYHLIKGYLSDDFEIESSMRYFGVELPRPYTVFSVRIDHFRKLILTMDEIEKQLLVYQVLSIVKNRLAAFGGGVATIERMNAVTAIVGGAVTDEVINLCEEIKTESIFKAKHGVTVGVGRSYERASEIAVSFREAEAALRYRHVLGYNTVIPIHYAEAPNGITYAYPREKEEALVFAAVTGEYDNCRYLLRDITHALASGGKLPPRLLPKIVVSIVFSISRAAAERGLNVEGRFNEIFPAKMMFALQTPEDAGAFLAASLKEFCAYVAALMDDSKQATVAKVKTYIDEKYFENITLYSMAALAETTPEYLNAIFAAREGMNIYDYTLKARLDQAKRLMRETALDDETIAVNIGYDDVKHYRAVFRGKEGILPAQYRNSRR